MRPTLGRIVIFNLPDGGEAPAMVVHCDDASVHLKLFLASTHENPVVRGVRQGVDPGQWKWPEIVKPEPEPEPAPAEPAELPPHPTT